MGKNKEKKKDPIVQAVKKKYSDRSALGIEKYGITLAGNNEPIWKRLNHLQEELMDATLYIEWIMGGIYTDAT